MDFSQFSSALQGQLTKLEIARPFDLLLHLPLRYEDETHLYRMVDARPGESVLVEGTVVHAEIVSRPRRQLVARVSDGSGELFVRLLHFYPNQQRQLAVGQRVRLLGELRHGYYGPEFVHPRLRVVTEDTALAETLTPVYPTVEGLRQPVLRKLIAQSLTEAQAAGTLADTLSPAWLHRVQGRLPADFDWVPLPFAEAVQRLHAPPPDASAEALRTRSDAAWQRLKFDELLAQQLAMRLAYRQRRQQRAPILADPPAPQAQPPAAAPQPSLTQGLLTRLPFALTAAQQRALAEIHHDLAQTCPMQRLLQGDVGSGKTIVSALAAARALESGYQVALMAPTEILAEQHHRKFCEWLEPLGIVPLWLSGSLKARQKRAAREQIENGVARMVIGTHALLQDGVRFLRLGLAIVDEQHRFGVQQRLVLRRGWGDATPDFSPHLLMMSATPIPRTLAMSYYADLDVSLIDELPPGRTPVQTRLISTERRAEMIGYLRQRCLTGSQAYWVCPLIEESEALTLSTVTELHARLSTALPDLRVGLVHGKLASAEKAAAMEDFSSGRTQVLVATTVIEVGVDVPNASLMVIEHAERMGLAQLHQLRGRVGRGAQASHCVLLFSEPLGDTARERLKVIYRSHDGFEIARADLRIRGPGELLGARQSGVPMLRFADPEQDAILLDAARQVASELLTEAPAIADAHLERWMAGRAALLGS